MTQETTTERLRHAIHDALKYMEIEREVEAWEELTIAEIILRGQLIGTEYERQAP